MLNTASLVGFVATAKPAEAKRFYQGTLGLELIEDGPYALVFNANGTTLRIQKVQEVCLAPYTSLGWEVSNISAETQRLSEQGVVFEHHEGLPQDHAGFWRTPNGSSVAWFKDPDGNTLSLTEHAPK